MKQVKWQQDNEHIYSRKEIQTILDNWYEYKHTYSVNDNLLGILDIELAETKLNKDQQWLLDCFKQQLTTTDIALELQVSKRTIQRRKKQLMTRLDILLNGNN